MHACVCVPFLVCEWKWERELQGHQTVFEVEKCAGDKDQNSQGTEFNFNSLYTNNSLDSLSLSHRLSTPLILKYTC